MKKLIILMALAICCHGWESSYFGYGGIHMMAGYPMLGVGLRSEQKIHGYDISANLFPYFTEISHLPFHVKGLYLFHPNAKRLYFGAGLGCLNEPETMRKVSGSFEGSLGFEWKMRNGNRFFLEADAIVPWSKVHLRTHKGDHQEVRQIWPGATFGFGF